MEKKDKKGTDRRDVLRWLAAAPLAGSTAAQAADADAPKLNYTPPIEMGPFYPVRKPHDRDADLTIIKGHKERAQGEVVEIFGRVLARDGKPVPHAVLEVWQANHHGRYTHPADKNPAPLDANFQGYALVRTDKQGRYRLRTVKPGAYPAGPNWMRPPHVHFDVQGQADRVTLQLFFPGEALNEKDEIFKGIDEKYRHLAVAREAGQREGIRQLEWDIVLNYG